MCKTCFSRNTSKCYICGKTFKSSTGDEIYSYHHSFIDLCPECVKSHIFECSNCKELRLTEERAISKKLEKRDNIYIFCTLQCSCCNKPLATIFLYCFYEYFYSSTIKLHLPILKKYAYNNAGVPLKSK